MTALPLLLTLALTPADTIRLSLSDAVARAHESNAMLVAQRADTRAIGQMPLEASRAFLPTVRIDANGVRTTDPVAVFGLKLRQENFQMEDLALDALNRPPPYGGFGVSASVELPLFAPEGLFQHAAARRGTRAGQAELDRIVEATTFDVSQAYWGAQLAGAEVRAMESALLAARAHVASAEAMREQGLVTGLDARLARVRAAELEGRRIAAAAKAANAHTALTVLIGLDDSQPLDLTDSLSTHAVQVCVEQTSCDVSHRADLTAALLGVEAANLNVRAAVASNLPSVAAFGSLSRYARSSPWGRGSGDWTIGIGVTWSPFRALSGIGAVRRARAERDAATARLDAVRQQADLEVISAERLLAAALEQVAVAEIAHEEGLVALDQARLRYATGIAPVTELLDVQAASVDAELRLLRAHHDHVLARAALDFAYGALER